MEELDNDRGVVIVGADPALPRRGRHGLLVIPSPREAWLTRNPLAAGGMAYS